MWRKIMWSFASTASSSRKPRSPSTLRRTSSVAFQAAMPVFLPAFFPGFIGRRPCLRSSGLAAGNQARAAVAREVVVHPLDKHQQAIFELHQVHEVHEDPGKPGGEAGDVQLTEFGHGPIAADGREIALVEVVEGRGLC